MSRKIDYTSFTVVTREQDREFIVILNDNGNFYYFLRTAKPLQYTPNDPILKLYYAHCDCLSYMLPNSVLDAAYSEFVSDDIDASDPMTLDDVLALVESFKH